MYLKLYEPKITVFTAFKTEILVLTKDVGFLTGLKGHTVVTFLRPKAFMGETIEIYKVGEFE